MSLDEQTTPGGQPQFSQFPPPSPARERFSGLAITGFILTFLILPLGFILSVIAIFRTGPGKARGRGLAIAGTVISLLFIGTSTAVVVTVANATLFDPGCVGAKQALLNTSQGSDAPTLLAAVDKLNDAAAKAKHDDVRAAVTAISGDYAQLAEGLKTGILADGVREKIVTDAGRIDELCTLVF